MLIKTKTKTLQFYRNIFSPTESIESSGTASVKTVEFIPVKEKIKMIAAQQEELMRKEEASKSQGNSSQTETKQKGVRILPPSPVTVRKMMVEEELDREVKKAVEWAGRPGEEEEEGRLQRIGKIGRLNNKIARLRRAISAPRL